MLDDLSVPQRALLRNTHLGFKVCVNQAIAWRIPHRPLETIQQRPRKEAADVDTLRNRFAHYAQMIDIEIDAFPVPDGPGRIDYVVERYSSLCHLNRQARVSGVNPEQHVEEALIPIPTAVRFWPG